MAIVDKIKSDIQFRNKVIGGACVFTLLMAGGVAGVLAMNNEKIEEEQPADVVVAVVPSDTIRTVSTKRTIYNQMDYFKDEENKELKVVFDEKKVGKSKEEIEKIQQKEDDEIASYMRQRREEHQKIIASNDEPIYKNMGGGKRRYNPYAPKEDWIEKEMYNDEEQLNNYQTGREKIQIQEQQLIQQKEVKKKASIKSRKKAQSFEDLSPTEQRKILLETGQSQYQETEEFSAMIMSSGMVKSGETIILITKEDAYLNFEKIPKGTTIAGIVSFGENRLQVNFSTIRLKKKIIKVNLTLYGLDGLAGLPVGSDLLSKEINDTGFDEATDEDITGTRVERIGKKIFKSSRTRKELKVDLGRDIMCILVNNNLQ